MQFSSLSLVFLAVIGAIANPIAVDSELENRDVQLSKYGGECNLKTNACRYTKGGKSVFVPCGTAANKRCKSDRHHCEYDEHHKRVDCQTPV
ncbi:hypothetical protein PDE_01229 [Penicillium oxalicum 114-2]|uniref:Antifungal protein opdH n=1 Tax=Penicillium oxalicum (strain 114-2 / CGMCC 5302) TaxID=933388 RepID=OPDH_PENO1